MLDQGRSPKRSGELEQASEAQDQIYEVNWYRRVGGEILGSGKGMKAISGKGWGWRHSGQC